MPLIWNDKPEAEEGDLERSLIYGAGICLVIWLVTLYGLAQVFCG